MSARKNPPFSLCDAAPRSRPAKQMSWHKNVNPPLISSEHCKEPFITGKTSRVITAPNKPIALNALQHYRALYVQPRGFTVPQDPQLALPGQVFPFISRQSSHHESNKPFCLVPVLFWCRPRRFFVAPFGGGATEDDAHLLWQIAHAPH